MTQLTKKELKVFSVKCNELLEHIRLYGIPNEQSHFVMDKMMLYRINGIKARPELLEAAKKIDTKGIFFN